MRRGSSVLGVILAVLLAIVGVAGPVAASEPPFTPPASWARICDAVAGPGEPLVRGMNCRWTIVDGHPRRSLVYVPTTEAFPLESAWPFVLALHGSGSSGERFWRRTRWTELAERKGVIVAFPSSLRYALPGGGTITRWNSFNVPNEVDLDVRLDGYPEGAPMPADDVGFMDALLGDIGGQLTIDPARIHLCGSSNGARFAMRLAVERSGVFASAAAVGGGIELIKDPPRHLPVLFGRGALDELILGDYNAVHQASLTSIPLAFNAAMEIVGPHVLTQVETLGLRPANRRVIERPTFTRVLWQTPQPGKDDGQTMTYLLMAEVRHVYPNGLNNPHAFDWTARAWRFFVGHPKP